MVAAPETVEPAFPPFPYASLLDDATFGDWRDELATNGFAVVKAIPTEQALNIRDQAHAWMESLGHGYRRDDPSTFKVATLPSVIKGGMVHTYGIAHEDWVWETRSAPGVREAFAKLWGTDELITSFDAASIMLPHRTDVINGGKWEHVDQSPSRNGFFCCQGIVNLNHNGPEDGGLMVLKGSSKLFEQYFDEYGRKEIKTWGPVDWYGFRPEQQQYFFDRGCEWVKVEAEPGDLILWDSRSMHYNVRPQGDRDRVCTYVCMAPSSLLSPDDRAQRVKAFSGHLGTTHVPFANIFCRPHEAKVREETGLPDPLDTGIPKKPVVPTKAVMQLVGSEAY